MESIGNINKILAYLACIKIYNDKIVYADPNFESMCGYSFEELSNLKLDEIFPPEDVEKIKTEKETIARIIGKNGNKRYVLLQIQRVPFNGGTSLLIKGVDITELKKIEEREALLSSIMEGSADAITAVDLQGRIIYWNKAAEKLFGFKSEEIVGKHIFNIIPEDRRDELEEIWRKIEKEGFVRGFETERLTKEGKRIPVEITVSPMRECGKIIGYSAIFHDISRRKETEKKFLEIVTKYKNICDFAPIGVLIIDKDGYIAYANPYVKRFHKFDIEGKNIFDSPCLKANGIDEIIRRSLNGEHVDVEGEFILQEGRKIYYKIKCAPLKTPDGEVNGVISLIEDITERKILEKRLTNSHEKLKKAYRELKKLDELKSNIISNVSHELKTPITIVKGFVELSLAEKNRSKRNLFLKKAINALMRLNCVVDDLIAISHIEKKELELNREDFDIISLTEECVQTKLESMKEKKIKVFIDIEDDLPLVNGDKEKIKKVIINLLDNAIKFNKENGRIFIKIKKKNKRKVEFRITDTGIGIPQNRIREIFKPLTQLDPNTTRKYGGTGTGLAVVKRIVEMHGGTIKVKSAPNKGSTFFFTLPAAS